MKKPTTTNKAFDIISKELGFLGHGMTRYIEREDHYLLINHQKSSYSKIFYINVGLIYKSLQTTKLSEDDLLGAFKTYNPTAKLHVMFRINSFPGSPLDLKARLDELAISGKIDQLIPILRNALDKLLKFLEKNYERETIRSLSDNKKLSAMILKEV